MTAVKEELPLCRLFGIRGKKEEAISLAEFTGQVLWLHGARFDAGSRTGLFHFSVHVLGVVIPVFTALLVMTLLVFLLRKKPSAVLK